MVVAAGVGLCDFGFLNLMFYLGLLFVGGMTLTFWYCYFEWWFLFWRFIGFVFCFR